MSENKIPEETKEQIENTQAPEEKTGEKKKKGKGRKAAKVILVCADLSVIAGLAALVVHYRDAVIDAGTKLSDTKKALNTLQEQNEETGTALSGQQEMSGFLEQQLEEAQTQLETAQAKADSYDALNEAFDGLPAANEDFFASANVLTMSVGESAKLYVYLETDESKSYETVMEASNDCISAEWDSDDFDSNGINSVTVTGEKEGVSVLGFINGYNEETIHVVVMVSE